MANETNPKTLQQAIIYFSNPKNCLDYLVARRWPDGVICPTCGRKDVTFLEKQNKWQCKSAHQRRQFSVKVGTIFEDSPLGLDKWLAAVWMITNCKNGISSYEISRALGVTQKTAWFMDHRIRLAMQSGSFLRQMSGHVEVDETFIGGKARNMHRGVKARRLKGATGFEGKMAVMGLLERHGEVRTVVIPNTKRKSLRRAINAHVEPGSMVYSDALRSYNDLNTDYIHSVINHAEKYVDGQIHTNGIENFWSLLKRSINGTYVSVEPFHLFRYLDEQTFRFNSRHANDGERFQRVMEKVSGKRLTYSDLTGKDPASSSTPF
ncbi:MAG TPA: IS1595 family transposase [Pyrinomonadaceae bacterium]|nr:IS1595 family transposase [Pyrinomonadaceae bacterium]